MHRLIAVVFALGYLMVGLTFTHRIGQAQQQPTASVSGRVTVGGKPAMGLTVVLTPTPSDPSNFLGLMYQSGGTFKARTTQDGRYRVDSLPAGRYQILVLAPAMVPATSSIESGLTSVREAEQVDGVDFDLKPGGIITGRVTDAKGRPVIGATIQIAGEGGGYLGPIGQDLARLTSASANRTDDRGVYRLFGLAAGRYVISVGGRDVESFMGTSRSFPETFHPGVIDRKSAEIIELAAAAEVADVDIQVGLRTLTYKATGRVVDADSGKSLPGIMIGYSGSSNSGSSDGVGKFGLTNDRGEFRLEGIKPGKYDVYALFDEDSHYFSDVSKLDVSNSDATGVTINAHRGLSISGIATIEGATDTGSQADLARAVIRCFRVDGTKRDDQAAKIGGAKIAPDGSFSILGLSPGTYRIISGDFLHVSGLDLIRVERSDVEADDGIIQVTPGEPVSDVRLVFGRSNRAIHGHIVVVGGSIPPDVAFEVHIEGVPATAWLGREVEADATGKFTIDRLSQGEYKLTVEMVDRSRTARPDPVARLTATQTVVVSSDADSEVIITFDLSKKD